MSTALAIQVVTRGLIDFIKREVKRQHDEGGLPELPLDVTDYSPNELKSSGKTFVNLFLYHLAPNAAFRIAPLPGRGKPGDLAPAPLALNLFYLVTVYSLDAKEHAHHVLGRVMSALHLSSPLSRADLRELVLDGDRVTLSGLADQIERVKLTPVTLSSDEMARLWTGFQSPYRLSVAYEASVVLIESTKPVVAPLPVLTRGRTPPDGFEADASTSFPNLTAARFDFPPPPAARLRQLDAGRLGDTLNVAGKLLVDPNRDLTLLFEHPRFVLLPLDPVPPATVTPDGVTFVVSKTADRNWPAGIYTLRAKLAPKQGQAAAAAVAAAAGATTAAAVAAAVASAAAAPAFAIGRTQTTNAVTFALVPDVKPEVLDEVNTRVLVVPVTPRIRAGQQASLLLSEVELPLGALTKDVKGVRVWFGGNQPPVEQDDEILIDARKRLKAEFDRRKSGKYVVRLRVDGVDSFPFDPADKNKTLQYANVYRVTLTPDGAVEP
jgi:hypothetical protein